MSDISEDEEDFQKIGEDLQIDHLLNIHPELKQINERELEALSRIIRDKYGNIVDDLHKTMPILTKYERTRILGLRTKQINNGSEVFVENNNNIIDGYSLAVLELNQKKVKLIY